MKIIKLTWHTKHGTAYRRFTLIEFIRYASQWLRLEFKYWRLWGKPSDYFKSAANKQLTDRKIKKVWRKMK